MTQENFEINPKEKIKKFKEFAKTSRKKTIIVVVTYIIYFLAVRYFNFSKKVFIAGHIIFFFYFVYLITLYLFIFSNITYLKKKSKK